MLKESRYVTQDIPDARIETITPDVANCYLRLNPSNRPLTASRIKTYAQDMRDGKWKLNGEAILFDANGLLINGQHRLLACIEAKQPFMTYVIRGLDPNVRTTTDTGRPRSAADNIGMAGAENTRMVAAAIMFILRYQNGAAFHTGQTFSHDDIVSFWMENREISQSAVMGGRAHHILQTSLGCGLHFLFSKRDHDAADKFMGDLASGVGLDSTDSVYVLREFLIQNKGSKQKHTKPEIAARVVRAWNNRRTGVKTRILKGTFGSGSARTFPTIL